METGSKGFAYLMHPLGSGSNREQNRKSACLWQAAVQEIFHDYIVIAPWIALSGAWGEERRALGLEIDFATIERCAACIVAGPTDGPESVAHVGGVSPGMALEIRHAVQSDKPVIDVRREPLVLEVLRRSRSTGCRVLYEPGDEVLVDGKPSGRVVVVEREERAPGVFYYRLRHETDFYAHEQALRKIS